MIKDQKALSIAESQEFVDKENSGEILAFMKKFVSMKPGKAKELRKKLEGLDLMKLDDKGISKIIDVLPENEEELNKTTTGLNLDEEEAKKILEALKEFKWSQN